jgi:hypothetical protein
MPRKKKDQIPRLVIPPKATLRQIYAKYRQEFTAADLQEYTEENILEDGVPIENILTELEAIQRRDTRKRKQA